MEENSTHKLVENARGHTNNRMQKKQNNFEVKYGKGKRHNRKGKWISNMKKELQELEENPEVIIHLELLRAALKKVLNWKTPVHDGIHGFWF